MFANFRKTISTKNMDADNTYLIIGLGNPGMQYEKTRHNTGFMAMDIICKTHECSVNKLKFNGLFGKCEIAGKTCFLIKPQTFMNKSGKCVSEFANFYKIKPENIIVIFDDISLDVGKLRIKRKGSHGGHNGIKDICLCLNSNDFPRIKIGVGEKPNPNFDLADWVLSKFTTDEFKRLNEVLPNAADAVEMILKGDIDKAMNAYNK